MRKVLMIDPPSGWKYGFPKVLPEGLTDTRAWLVENGYPQAEIDRCGNHFYCRHWETEIEEMNAAQKLYKIDTKGHTRVWWIEYDDEKYRTHAGIEGGKIVTSGWTYPEGKNIGRSNATTVAQQVLAEVESEYAKKQHQGKYHLTKESTSSGAKFYECMLATKYDPSKHVNFPYYSQPKLDGVRCLISKDGMQSRQGKPILSAPHILEALQPFFEAHPDVVLDGELYNHELKNDFEKIISLVRKTKPTPEDLEESKRFVQYHVYDVILSNKYSPSYYECRRNFLTQYVVDVPMIHVVTTTMAHNKQQVDQYLSLYLEQGYEGQMLRGPDSPYEGKRSKFLIKHKEFEDEEFEIVNIVEGNGNWAGCAKSIEIRLEDGTTQFSNARGTNAFLADILKNKDQYIGTDVTVRYQNRTEDNKLRFPVVVAFWKGRREL